MGVASGEDIIEGPGTWTENGERNELALSSGSVWGVSCRAGVKEVSFLGVNERFGVSEEKVDFPSSMAFDHPGRSLPFIICASLLQ